jgi:outer membrane protein TolC
MSAATEEARRRARHIRDEALARHAERDRASLAALHAELAEIKAMLAGQQEQLARLTSLVAELTDRPVAKDLLAIPPSSPRPLSARKRAALERIRDLRAQDHSFARITEIFLAEGVPTLSGQGQWSKGTLWNLWKNHSHQLSSLKA